MIYLNWTFEVVFILFTVFLVILVAIDVVVVTLIVVASIVVVTFVIIVIAGVRIFCFFKGKCSFWPTSHQVTHKHFRQFCACGCLWDHRRTFCKLRHFLNDRNSNCFFFRLLAIFHLLLSPNLWTLELALYLQICYSDNWRSGLTWNLTDEIFLIDSKSNCCSGSYWILATPQKVPRFPLSHVPIEITKVTESRPSFDDPNGKFHANYFWPFCSIRFYFPRY